MSWPVAPHSIARFDDLDAGRHLARAFRTARQFPRGRQTTDTAAHHHDGRATHLGRRGSYDVREDRREAWIVVERGGANEVEADLTRHALGLNVDIEEHF